MTDCGHSVTRHQAHEALATASGFAAPLLARGAAASEVMAASPQEERPQSAASPPVPRRASRPYYRAYWCFHCRLHWTRAGKVPRYKCTRCAEPGIRCHFYPACEHQELEP